MIRTGLLATAAMLVAMTPAIAQTTSPSAGNGLATPEKQSAAPIVGGRSDNLSSKLSKSGGVITPRGDPDPGIHVGAPDPRPGSTPIIPPSATGGSSAK